MIQILDKQFVPFLSANVINQRIKELADTINSDYANQNVTFIVVLNGAFMFAAELLKQINVNCEITFVKISSYEGMQSVGKTTEIIGLTTSLVNKNVIVVEDIVDTGITMDSVLPLLLKEDCKSVKIASLLFKTEAFKGKYLPDYVGFEIENKFVVGYGLDYNEYGRNLDAIYKLKE